MPLPPRHASRLLAPIGALACAWLLCACGGGSNDGSTRIRLLNASPDLAQGDLDIDKDRIASAVPALTLSAYKRRDGGAVSLQVRDGGAGATVASSPATLKDDAHYTLIAYGTPGAMRTSLLEEDQPAPASGQSKLMVLNLAPDAGPVDVFLTSDDAALAGAVPFVTRVAAGAGSGFVTRDSGSYRLRVTGAGRRDDVRLDLPAIELASAQVATLVLRGGAGGVLVHGLMLPQRGEAIRRDNPSARVRLVAALARGRVDGQLDGQALLADGASPAIGAYQLVPAGARTLQASVDGRALAPIAVSLQPGADHTLLLRGPATAPTVDVLTDDNRLPAGDGQARLRLLNGLARPATLNFNYSPIAEAIGPGQAGLATVRATGAGLLTVSAAGSTAPLHAERDFAAQTNSVYSVFLVGDDAAPQGIVRLER
ncbi:DUF4397 domain-containing protein [Mitsuaria sp. GD03876]|uniref:DUF4397 domain-containing protein n=1 Tax=Mitsuaria sp. GD03876 TaxID=2975399 RepID=UPI00244885E7|nr:DUF4397 domain-containing protein [Mitsuaria sp. GD03876]MDH0863046.1 DUF4397 domain-containing protein [Mitsuaria sp. GD03876]